MKHFARLLAFISATLGALHFYHIRSATGMAASLPKMLAGAFSPYLAVLGLVGAIVGLRARAPLAVIAGLFGACAAGRYVRRVTTTTGDFAAAFGPDAQDQISPKHPSTMLKERWTWRLPASPEPRWEQNIPFWTVPGTNRQLLCDIWQPPTGVPASGLAFIYIHGSGWHFLDKDVGTRPFFRHLAAQGHVVMDVAYRLCPETDWRGMLDDVKWAIAWMKTNAAQYGVDPNRIVLGGASAGGHLALLAAYTARCPELTPSDVAEADLSVRGVVSWYGPTDMHLYYTYASTPFGTVVGKPQTWLDRLPARMAKTMGFEVDPPAHWPSGVTVQDAMMQALLGGTPTDVPDVYRQASPITYVSSDCPPTLLLQGEHDSIVSAEGARTLAQQLRAAGVPVIHVEYPQTEHAFDLILPQFSPSAQGALYETERFLALLAEDVVITR